MEEDASETKKSRSREEHSHKEKDKSVGKKSKEKNLKENHQKESCRDGKFKKKFVKKESTDSQSPVEKIPVDSLSLNEEESKNGEKTDEASITSQINQAPWYWNGKDLGFSAWLLVRCTGIRDLATPNDIQLMDKVHRLYELQKRVRDELRRPFDPTKEEGNKVWTVVEIMDQTNEALQSLQNDQYEFLSSFIKNLYDEVVENVSELLLSRGTLADILYLKQWRQYLLEQDQSRQQQDHKGGSKKRNKQKADTVESKAAKQIDFFICMLEREPGTVEVEAFSSFAPSEQLEQGIKKLFYQLCLDHFEEHKRWAIAKEIENVLQMGFFKWKHHQVNLFGSSLSWYGSKYSDLDMCFSDRHIQQEEEEKKVSHNDDEEHQGEEEENDDFARSDECKDLKNLITPCYNNIKSVLKKLNDKGQKPRVVKKKTEALYFEQQLNVFLIWLDHQMKDQPTSSSSNSKTSAKKSKQAAHTGRGKKARRRNQDDLFRIRHLLLSARYPIKHVIATARIPIIRFLHPPSGLEVDLCLYNSLATRNTLLLRTYASFDERARILGICIKHWAKSRSISDSSAGFLSSYSYVLLTIFFLQRAVAPGILPNLQDSNLLKGCQQARERYEGYDTTFCTDPAASKEFLERQNVEVTSNTSKFWSKYPLQSLGRLLLDFFHFYVHRFNFMDHVVSIRHPDMTYMINKDKIWGRRLKSTWRISIQDPFEIKRDLGCVLQGPCQKKIMEEFERAFGLLVTGEDFLTTVCQDVRHTKPISKSSRSPLPQPPPIPNRPLLPTSPPPPPLPISPPPLHDSKDERASKVKSMEPKLLWVERPYQLILLVPLGLKKRLLASASRIKWWIHQIFLKLPSMIEGNGRHRPKSSFRVGKIDKAESVSTGGQIVYDTWRVELLCKVRVPIDQVQNKDSEAQTAPCPIILKDKTRLEWISSGHMQTDKAQDSTSFVWLFHEYEYQNSPCFLCYSPLHEEINCPHAAAGHVEVKHVFKHVLKIADVLSTRQTNTKKSFKGARKNTRRPVSKDQGKENKALE